jgi:hypothetical protein
MRHVRYRQWSPDQGIDARGSLSYSSQAPLVGSETIVMLRTIGLIHGAEEKEVAARKRNKRIRIRESLNKLRCQRPDNHDGDYRQYRDHGLSSLQLENGKIYKGTLEAPSNFDDDDAKFLERYNITIHHTQKTSQVSLDDNDGTLVANNTTYPRHRRHHALTRGNVRGEESVFCEDENTSLVDTLITDWETVDGEFPSVDDYISQEGDYTIGYDEYDSSTLPSSSTRHYYSNGVVDEFVDVIDDFTYFFRCLRREAQKQLVKAGSKMHCGSVEIH